MILPPHESESCYRLTPLQQGMLYHAVAAPGTGVDIEQMVVTISAPVDTARLKAAWEQVVARHQILRTAFRWETAPLQEVASRVEVPWTEEDWSNLSADDQEKRFAEFLHRDRIAGFTMDRPPLLRLQWLRHDAEKFRLIWTFHHALLDGRSFPLVLGEVFALYDGEPLGPVPPPYRYFVEWLGARDFKASESFWRTRFGGFTAPTPIPVEHLGECATTPSQGEADLALSTTLTAQLRTLATEHGFTLNTLVQGAWALLLGRYSGEDDVVFGVTRACRRGTVEEAEDMVGLFINTLPLRVALPAKAELLPWLKELRAQWVAMREHEHTPLAQVQAWSDVGGGRTLFDTLVVFENYELNATLQSRGDAWKNRHFRLHEQTNFALTLAAYAGEELLLRIEYDRSRFAPETIERLLGHLSTLLGSMADPTKTLGDLPLLTTAEEHQLTHEWAQRRPVEYPERTLHQLFGEQAARTPDAVAVRCEDQQLTYAELDRKAAGLAHHLHQLGVGPETIVGLCLDRSLDLVVGVLAILKAGAAYLPIDLSYPPERLAFMLEDAQAPVVLTHTSLSARLPEHGAKVVTIDTFTPEGEYHDSAASADALAYVIFTSGSTGKPKGCCITHRNVVRLMAATHPWFGFDAKDTWTLFHSIAFDFSVWELWGPLLYGGRLVVVPHAVSRSPEAFHELLAREKVTVLNQTPSAFRQLIAADASQPKLEKLRLVIFGGEALEMQSLRPWFDRYGDAQPQLVNMYGITETTVHVTYRPLKLSDVQGGSVIGEAIPDLEVFVLDQALKPVPIGVPGEMFVGGAGLARGYLRRPELTAQRFIEHPWRSGERLYRTGDLARFLPDRDIEYLGRIDQQVKIRGFRIELGEIESVLLKHEAIREAVVIARDQRLLAYLVPKIPGVLPAANELRTHLKAALPDYMVPAAFVPLERVPLTNNGKTDVRALPEPAAETGGDRPVGRAETTLHLELIELWETLLKRKPIGIHDDFFELGGHSLLAAQMLTTLEQRHGRRVPFAVLFEQATIAHLSAWLVGEERRLSIETPIVPIQTQGNKTPLFFLHGDFSGGGFFCRHLARYIGSDRPFYAIHPHGLHGELPPTTIEAMAAERLEAVRRIQPYGPYLLGGFCNGAIVAFEMARQLESMGESVPAIIMFGADGSNFRYRHVDALARSLSSLFQDSEANRAERFLRWRAQARKVEDWGRSQLLRFRAATRDAGHIPRRAAELLRKWTGTNGNGNTPTLELGNGCAALEDATPKVERAYITGLTAYVPGSVASRLILLWPEEDPAPGGKYPAYGWESVSTDSRVITVPGEHHSAIALEQNLRVVADHVRKELDAVDPEPVEDEVP